MKVFIVGGHSGIGKAIVEHLFRIGSHVAMVPPEEMDRYPHQDDYKVEIALTKTEVEALEALAPIPDPIFHPPLMKLPEYHMPKAAPETPHYRGYMGRTPRRKK